MIRQSPSPCSYVTFFIVFVAVVANHHNCVNIEICFCTYLISSKKKFLSYKTMIFPFTRKIRIEEMFEGCLKTIICVHVLFQTAMHLTDNKRVF